MSCLVKDKNVYVNKKEDLASVFKSAKIFYPSLIVFNHITDDKTQREIRRRRHEIKMSVLRIIETLSQLFYENLAADVSKDMLDNKGYFDESPVASRAARGAAPNLKICDQECD